MHTGEGVAIGRAKGLPLPPHPFGPVPWYGTITCGKHFVKCGLKAWTSIRNSTDQIFQNEEKQKRGGGGGWFNDLLFYKNQQEEGHTELHFPSLQSVTIDSLLTENTELPAIPCICLLLQQCLHETDVGTTPSSNLQIPPQPPSHLQPPDHLFLVMPLGPANTFLWLAPYCPPTLSS